MPFMKNAVSGAVVGPLADDSAEYLYLQEQRQAGGTNRPLWEDIPVEDAEAAGIIVPGQVAQTVQALLDAVAAGANINEVVGQAPFAGTVAKVAYYPNAAIAGVATNNRTFNLINTRNSDVVATENMAAGVNMAANAENDIPLSGTPANLAVNSGDNVEWQSLAVGTGIADPGGLVVVTFTRE